MMATGNLPPQSFFMAPISLLFVCHFFIEALTIGETYENDIKFMLDIKGVARYCLIIGQE